MSNCSDVGSRPNQTFFPTPQHSVSAFYIIEQNSGILEQKLDRSTDACWRWGNGVVSVVLRWMIEASACCFISARHWHLGLDVTLHAPSRAWMSIVYNMRCLFTFGHGGLCVDESGFAFMLPLISWCSLNLNCVWLNRAWTSLIWTVVWTSLNCVWGVGPC